MSHVQVESWPASLGAFWSWHMAAACRDVDKALFFSPEGERGPRRAWRERAAKRICSDCPVKRVCAAYAIATREPYGTWGGMSERDRREICRRTDPSLALVTYRRALADWEKQQPAVRR